MGKKLCIEFRVGMLIYVITLTISRFIEIPDMPYIIIMLTALAFMIRGMFKQRRQESK